MISFVSFIIIVHMPSARCVTGLNSRIEHRQMVTAYKYGIVLHFGASTCSAIFGSKKMQNFFIELIIFAFSIDSFSTPEACSKIVFTFDACA